MQFGEEKQVSKFIVADKAFVWESLENSPSVHQNKKGKPQPLLKKKNTIHAKGGAQHDNANGGIPHFKTNHLRKCLLRVRHRSTYKAL